MATRQTQEEFSETAEDVENGRDQKLGWRRTLGWGYLRLTSSCIMYASSAIETASTCDNPYPILAMSRRMTLTERFRRLSTPEVFRRSSKVEASLQLVAEATRSPPFARSKSVPDTLISHDTRPNLLTLPTEICAEVLSHVDFEDLCAFRLVNRTAQFLLSEGEIVRRWICEHVGVHQMFLHPAPSRSTFAYLLEQQRRSRTVIDTAHVLVEYVEHEILKHTLRRANIDTDQYRQGLFGLVKIRLRDKMAPLLYTVQAYLERKAALVLGTAPAPEDSEHAFFAALDPPHLRQAHKCFMFLTWLSNQILSRPSYVGTMERTMRGWLSEPLDAANYRLYLLFGNLGALKRLVQLPSYKHRRRAVEACLRALDPEQNVLWREWWERMGSRVGGCPGVEAVGRGLSLKLDVEECWVRGAREVLVERGLLKGDEEVEVGSAWQCMDFLCDIAGYDILHTPPTWSTAE